MTLEGWLTQQYVHIWRRDAVVRVTVPADCAMMQTPRYPLCIAAIVLGLHAPLAFSLSLGMKPGGAALRRLFHHGLRPREGTPAGGLRRRVSSAKKRSA